MTGKKNMIELPGLIEGASMTELAVMIGQSGMIKSVRMNKLSELESKK